MARSNGRCVGEGRDVAAKGEGALAMSAVVVTSLLAVVSLPWVWRYGVATSARTQVIEAVGLAVGVVTAAVGAVIVRRRPGNAVGRLLCVAGPIYGVVMLSWYYAADAVDRRLRGPGPPTFDAVEVAAVWTSTWSWTPLVLVLLMLIPMMFPDGRVIGRGWRWHVIVCVGVMALIALLELARPGPLRFDRRPLPVDNPIGVGWIGAVERRVGTLLGLVMVGLVIVAFASLVVRYRRSGPLVRQQIKWLVFGFSAVLAVLLLGSVVPALAWINESFNVVMVVVPVSIAIAVLRYGLYEIDRFISRTVAWTLVTLLLVGGWATGILVLGSAARALSGSEPSELIVALTTLVMAALFRPTQQRIQRLVDRRFNRARYDAALTVASFAHRLRDQVALDEVVGALRVVSATSLEPATVSVWLGDARDPDQEDPS
jgi:hypothetical protein